MISQQSEFKEQASTKDLEIEALRQSQSELSENTQALSQSHLAKLMEVKAHSDQSVQVLKAEKQELSANLAKLQTELE